MRREARTGGRWAAVAAAAIGMIGPALAGCGSSGPEMARVYGKVTYQGQPVPKGTISFVPVDAVNGNPATGVLQSDGSYTLQTVEPGDGARLGEYRVAISTITEDQILDYIPKTPPPKPKPLIPEKYSDPATSGLTATVKSGTNDIPFVLQ